MALTPAVSAFRLLTSILLGGALGILSSFLQPPGRKHRHLMDLIFSLGTAWVWIYHSFAVCRGDIRIVYLAGMGAGLLLWEATAGRWMHPVFGMLWKFLAGVWQFFLFPWKNFWIFQKFCLHLRKNGLQ